MLIFTRLSETKGKNNSTVIKKKKTQSYLQLYSNRFEKRFLKGNEDLKKAPKKKKKDLKKEMKDFPEIYRLRRVK